MKRFPLELFQNNETMFFSDLKNILSDETLFSRTSEFTESLFDIVIKIMSIYVEGICGADELFLILEDVFKHIDEFEQFKSFWLSREWNRRKETWFCRNFDETNIKECQRIDHSYTTIPKDFPMWIYSGRAQDPIYSQVLNDVVVSVPQGSESSFTFKQK